jgi:AAA domain
MDQHINPVDSKAATDTAPEDPSPSIADVNAHLYALFPPAFVQAHPDGKIEIAYSDSSGNVNQGQYFAAFDLEAAAKFASAKNLEARNVYVGVALRRGDTPPFGRASDSDFLASNFAWAEFDGAGDYERIADIIEAVQLEPAIVVTTGTTPHLRQHIYFSIEGGITDGDKMRTINKSLQELLGSDHVHNPSRVMRLAGTINYPPLKKRERGYVAELVTVLSECEPHRYTADQLAIRVGATKAPGAQQKEGPDSRKSRSDDELYALLEKSRIAEKWHNSIRDATASMIGRGWPDAAIKLACASYCNGGAKDPELAKLIDDGRKKWDKPDTGDSIQPNAGPTGGSPIIATPYIWTEPEKIPKRDFLYGRRLLRKFLTATVAPGGVGKSTLEITEALAMVAGRPLLGVRVDAPLKVWFYNLEDPAEEIARRIQATAKQYFLGRDDIGDRLFVSCGREQPLVIAETPPRSSAVICYPIVDGLVAQLIEHRIDVLIVDPFVSCHKVEENDNNAIDMVAKEWGRVAELANCAIELVHHTRKGEQEVTTESARGAKALTDACRFVRVVNRMSEGDAQKAGVDNHRVYFRTYNDKANLAPPADKSDWFKLTSVDLGNGPLPGAGGDSVGVVTTWEWPDHLAGVTGRDFDKAAAVIRAGKWRADVQAKQWVGLAVAEAMRLDLDKKADKAKVKGLIDIWLKSGALIIVEGEDDKRNPRKFVEVKPDDD